MPSWKKLITSGSNAALNSLSMSGDIIPSQDNVHTLGTSTNRFQLNGGTPVTVGGSGTANTMTRFSAATEVQNSTITNTDTLTTVRHTNDGNKIFVVSGSNGELLSVSDEISTELLRVNDTSGIGVFKVESSGTLNAERLSASTEDFVLTYNSASGDIYFQSSSIIQGTANWDTMTNIPSGIVSGSDQVATTFAQTILDDTSAAAVRSTIGVDAAGTDNSTDVTLAGSPDYITISGQVITRNQIDLANDVTGTLAAGNIPNLNASKINAGTFDAARIPNLNASKITAGTLGVDRIPTLSAAKISDVEAGATADQTDAEIETAYNNQVSQVSSSERTAGTATGIRRFAPADIKSMIDTHETNTTYTVGDGGLTQKNFTTTLKNKLDGIEASADVTDATNVKASLPSGVISGSASQARTQLGVDAAGTDNSTDVTLGSTVTDVLSLSGQAISGVDAGNNRVVGWDDSESKISYLSSTDARSALGLGNSATLNTAAIADGGTGLATADQIHTFVTSEINSLIDSAPGTLNTLNELAAAIGDDSNFSASLAASHTLQQTSINALNDATSSFADSSHTHAASDITSGTFAVGRIPTLSAAKISDVAPFSQTGNYASLRAGGTTATDVGLGNVTNESKSTMFSSAALTGTPTAPTAATSTNTTQIATTAFVKAQGYTTTQGTVQTVSGTGTVSGLTLSDDGDSVDPTLTLGGTISLVAGDIPNLNASKINAGTLADARIPSLNASKITAGTFGVARIPTLTAAKISDFDTEVSNNTSVAANTAKTGYTDAAVKTKLDTETVVSGSASDVRTFLNVANGATNTEDPAITSDGSSPSLATGISASEIRTLIGAGTSSTSGTVTSVGGTGTVSGLSLSGTVTSTGNLTLGGTISLVAGDIPNLNASKITAGTLGDARIPSLNASKITAGTFGVARIPTLTAAKISDFDTEVSNNTSVAANTAKAGYTDAKVKTKLNTETVVSGSASDVRTFLNVADGANNYSHPTGAGNKHIPSGGASGQFLKYSSSGTAVWAAPSYTTSLAFSSITGKPTTLAGYGITDAFDGAYSSLTGTPTIPSAANNATITLSPGAGIAAIGNFTTDQSSNETLTIGVDGVLQDLDTLGAPTADGQFIVATGAGAFAYESGADARTSLGLGSAATSSTGDFAAASHSHTFASLTSKPTTLAGYGITDALASSTTVDDVSVANLKTRLAGGFGSNAVQIGDASDTVTIPGNLTVQGTQTINNVNLVSTSNGVVFEGTSDDANETTLVAANPTADRTITLPNAGGTVALTSDIPTVNNATLTLSPGAGIAAIGNFTANQSSNETLTIGVDGVLQDLDTLGAPTADGQFIVATGAGAFAYESAADARTSLGLGSAATSNTSAFAAASHNQAWSTITGTPTTLAGYGITDADNYGSWNLKTGGTQRTTVGSGGDLDIIGGNNVTVSYASGGRVTIAATDTDTVYTHPTHPGDDIDIDTTALTGATVISDLDLNITTDGLGHVTDANASVSTRNLTLSDLGYSGATNANNYSLPLATDTVRGGIELFSNTDQTVAANAVSTTAGRTYGIQLNSANQAVVNVPWTNTTYTVGDGGLTQKNFTSALKTKLDGIATGATNTEAPAIISDGATPTLASGITAAEVRSLIGAGTSSTTGTVDTSGTPVDNDFAKFTDANTIEGRSISEVKSDLSLNNVTNESKATMFASPTFTGTVSGVTKSHVGLGNVTNESKATMFSGAALTGTPTAPTAATSTNTTQIATTAFVKAQGYITSANGGNAATLDNLDSTDFYREVDSATATAGGTNQWVTVAHSTGARTHGEVIVTDNDSGDHAFIRIDWMRSYADSIFTVINCGGHANRITGVRVLEESADVTYGSKYLQILTQASSGYKVKVNATADVVGYGNHEAIAPVNESSKTGYAVEGNTIDNLDTYGFAAQQGIHSGGDIEVGGRLKLSTADSNTSSTTALVLNGTEVEKRTLGSNAFNSTSFLTAHPSISAASSVNNSGRTYIQDITVDSNGHITGITSATETVTNTDTQLTDAQVRSKISGTGLISYNSSTGVISTTANNYSLPAGSSSTRGGFKIGYTENGKNYPVEVSSEKMYVNVPWTDTNTNTTYSAGTGVTLSGTTFSIGQSVATNATVQFGLVRSSGDVVAYYSSDERLKDNFKPLTGALDKVNKLGGYEFDWNDKQDTYEAGTHSIGVKAQEVQEQYPDLVVERENGYLAVDYIKMNAVLIEAVKELSAKVEALEAKLK